ncbi:hypothetical protein L3Q82_002073 [Scortum barcoo]|uniref:Uncharacterized protein n=1 Tax=Scortum barcoo TaxID=214431 RepID=A0ACB8W4K7_9TELE|nr:hypothetical protein L3Q82_002073 [Scortum barcoo]
MAVTNQPGRYEPSDFQTGLLDFCDDCGTCCYGLWCYVCLGCSIASDMDECCLCGLSMPIRSVYRTRYNIKTAWLAILPYLIVSLHTCLAFSPLSREGTRPGISRQVFCPRIYEPVCGSDNITYGNECMLSLFNRRTGAKVVVVKKGPC